MVDCIVEFDYDAEQSDELTIKTGQIIKNVMTEDGGWWEGELDGKKGMFPDNFVKIIEKTPKDKPHATVEKKNDTKNDLKTAQRSSVKDLASRMKDGIPVAGSQKKKESHQSVIKRAKVLYSYEPDNDDELKLDVDDIVDVFKQEEEGWWEGSLNGKTGVFPSNFVQVVEELEPSVKTEHIPEEKPKESPQTEPKTKRIIGGVGLGNIFDGGPIKLRSATGSKKQPAEPEAKPDEPPSHPAPSVNLVKREKPERAVVRHSYDAGNEDELTLKVGEIVNIISKDAEDPGWWKGELNEKVGVFPDNFVEIMHTDEPRPKKPPPPASTPAATVKLPEKTATVEPVHTEKNVKKKDDLPSVEKSTPPALPSKKPSMPPPLLRKPARNSESSRPTSLSENKLPAPTTKEEPPKEMSQSLTEEKKSTGHFDDIQTSTDKLTHLAVSRPKGPSKRPPSQVFNHTEEERNGDVKETHWANDDKTVHSKRVSPPPAKEETHKTGPSHPPARPPEPTVTATIPTAALTSLHSAIEELKKEMLHLKTSTVSKAAFDELKQENEKLRHEVDSLKATSNRKFRDIINEVDDEKKIRLSTQVEIERIKKLVNESHV